MHCAEWRAFFPCWLPSYLRDDCALERVSSGAQPSLQTIYINRPSGASASLTCQPFRNSLISIIVTTYALHFAQSDLKRSGEHVRLAQRSIANRRVSGDPDAGDPSGGITQHKAGRDKDQIAAQPDQNVDYSARLWDDPLAQLSTFQIASQGQLDAARKSLSQTIDGAELGARLLVLQAIRPQLLASIFLQPTWMRFSSQTVGARYHQVAGELWSDCSSALQDQHLRK